MLENSWKKKTAENFPPVNKALDVEVNTLSRLQFHAVWGELEDRLSRFYSLKKNNKSVLIILLDARVFLFIGDEFNIKLRNIKL